MDALLDFIKILVPASVVLYAVYLMVRSFIIKEIELKKLEVRSRSIEVVLPVRLQAYERMTLFLERTSPQNLLVRMNQPGLTARDFHKLLLEEIRNEYNHNVSQQVYIGEEVWSLIKNAKEDLILEINEAAQSVSADMPSIELAKKIFEVALNKNVDPVGHALSELKKEIQRTF
ncbi:MAG TPA: hypothetical protein VK508_14245 [Cyclobacteriaceae bacterium]|nr:hypothetical protein [Cyclobacteriaceae bacterium]